MYAVFSTGGRQYRAVPGEVIRVEKLDADVGATIKLDQVFMTGDGDDIQIGAPLLKGATIEATVRGHGRHDKVMIVKFRRRKHHRKQMGHRQHDTEPELPGISNATKSTNATKAS